MQSAGLPQLTYLHLEKNRFTGFPKGAFKLVPGLLALHLENNSITKLEPDSLVGAEGLRALYLTGNAIGRVSPRALDQAGDLDTLHLGGNKLREVPVEALSKATSLRDLRLSRNPIRWVGPNAFQPLERTLKELYLDNMGLEKVRGRQMVASSNSRPDPPLHHVPFVFVKPANLTEKSKLQLRKSRLHLQL